MFFQSNNFNKFPFHYVLDILPLKSRLVPANVTLPLKFLTNSILFYGYIDYAAKYIKTTHKSRETMNYLSPVYIRFYEQDFSLFQILQHHNLKNKFFQQLYL